MSMTSPNLDDRTFEQLVEEARNRIRQSSSDWTDLSPNDPGMVLLEVFAHLTEVMIYRLNRVPEKAYIEFLRLIGVKLHPPSAASTVLRFSRSRGVDQTMEIPRGTRVAVSRMDSGREAPVFTTARDLTISAGETEAQVIAYHCDLVDAEIAGVGTGNPGMTIQVQRPPIISPTGDELDLVVGVEITQGELDEDAAVREHEGKAYRIWREVDSFTDLGSDRHAYVVDRMTGIVSFAPAVQTYGDSEGLEEVGAGIAESPAQGQEIKLWYRRGGGPNGNVAANTLTVLRDTLPGVEVTNPEAASGGRSAESLDNALIRGPQELHSLHRAVTARDFELVARSSQTVTRAKAYTRTELWQYANPGTVEVLLVPNLPDHLKENERVTVAALRDQETDVVRDQVQSSLDERRPMGTTCIVNWANYKTVVVNVRIVVSIQEDQSTVRQRVLDRLYETINPLPSSLNAEGWPFGQTLRASHIYEIALAEPGVRWVDQPRFIVDEVPGEDVNYVASDKFQPHTWYAASENAVYRSLNDGDSWEPLQYFDEEQVYLISPSSIGAGLLAVVTRLPEGGGSRIYMSRDSGESWEEATFTLAFTVQDMTWVEREDTPTWLMATDRGLYELILRPNSAPTQILVDRQDPDLGLYAVAVSRDGHVIVAAQETRGVFISYESNAFRSIGLQNRDVRVLEVQYDGVRTYLWAGEAAAGREDPGRGCHRWELRGAEDPVEGWQSFSGGWRGGSCLSLTFMGNTVLAGSYRQGVLRLDPTGSREWVRPDIQSGLPLVEQGVFQPIGTIASDNTGLMVMAGNLAGVFRSSDQGATYRNCSGREFSDRVTIPQTWLFCSGEHEVEVVSEDEAERN